MFVKLAFIKYKTNNAATRSAWLWATNVLLCNESNKNIWQRLRDTIYHFGLWMRCGGFLGCLFGSNLQMYNYQPGFISDKMVRDYNRCNNCSVQSHTIHQTHLHQNLTDYIENMTTSAPGQCPPHIFMWRLSPGIHWARKCWRPAPLGATGVPGSLRYSTLHCPWGPRWPGYRPAGPQGCGRRGCTGSSWTGCSGCRSRWAAAGVAEPAGPRNAARSWPSWRTL